MNLRLLRTAAVSFGISLVVTPSATPDSYVTPFSSHRWSSAAEIRFNDVGGIRFNDVGGIRFNDVGGIRFNDVGGMLFSDTSGIRFNDVGGIRFNDVGGIRFNDVGGGGPTVDLDLLDLIVALPDTSSVGVIITYHLQPTVLDQDDLRAAGIMGGTIFRNLPMIVVNATREQILAVSLLPAVRSIWSDRALSLVTDATLGYIGVRQAEADATMRTGSGLPFSGQGVSIAFVDTGIDATHPDLPLGAKVAQNVRLHGAAGVPLAFVEPAYTEGLPNTDLLLGHGTFGAGIAAGTGAASGGLYRGVAPGAGLVGLSVGDFYIINVLEGFDYILSNTSRYGIRIVNCSFATSGPFDPDDPVNIATRSLYDSGLSVVFAGGNHGPAPDTLNPYAVAPWVIGVASGTKAGRLSRFSSRGIFGEGLYHPTLTAPGEGIISTSSVSLQGVSGVSGVEDPSGGFTVPEAHRLHYSVASGTSFAAPHVAGVIALMLEADPALTPSEVKTILQQTATPMVSRDRSEAGAGYLDAWAALSLTLDRSRPFGSLIPEQLDQRPFRYLYGPAVPISGTVPAGAHFSVPLDLPDSPVAVQVSIGWGPFPSVADLDLSLMDSAGIELARSASFNALGFFGLTEGATAYRPVRRSAAAVVSFKTPSLADQPFVGQYQSVYPILDLSPDVAVLAPQDRRAATIALTTLAMTARVSCFCGAQKLSRGESARAVALAAQLPQTVPAAATFNDAGVSDPYFPYVESVANPAARRGQTMAPKKPWLFGTANDISRLELAVAAVKALGLDQEAQAREGEPLGLADEAALPQGTRGYVALALKHQILAVKVTFDGLSFLPDDPVTRLEGAHAVASMVAFVSGDPMGEAPTLSSAGPRRSKRILR